MTMAIFLKTTRGTNFGYEADGLIVTYPSHG